MFHSKIQFYSGLFSASQLSATLSLPSTKSSISRRPSGAFPITLSNPPARRRAQNGNASSNTPSPTVSPSNFFSSSSKPSSLNDSPSPSSLPPPIPPRSTASNTLSRRSEGQWLTSGQTPIKAERIIIRGRTMKRRDTEEPRNIRSDSVDAVAAPSPHRHTHHYHHHERLLQQIDRLNVPFEQGAVSD